ncbi:hypothetical protein [Macrococcus carouselicus]|uniref:Uncharacterized protein n=1 Tax=Macrococcus carouselicus TaxID=69969 RepID=A0A9Q8CMD5_9STAP|nr:hypothetical protein [Macrococcus carouselicus]TDM04078.1 hypothetical protein ERX40_02605 [Macrococcus carouselicus]
MKRILIFLIPIIFTLAACGDQNKKDLIGVWKIENKEYEGAKIKFDDKYKNIVSPNEEFDDNEKEEYKVIDSKDNKITILQSATIDGDTKYIKEVYEFSEDRNHFRRTLTFPVDKNGNEVENSDVHDTGKWKRAKDEI